MVVKTDNINTRLLFIISFSITALAICLFEFVSPGPPLQVYQNFWLNVLFINITFLGSVIFCMVLILYLIYKKQYILVRLISGSIFSTILLIQIIKNYLHNDGIQIFFEDEQYLFNTDKKSIQFISSHTALAFTLVTVFALHFYNRKIRFFLILVGFIVAYSRIYLSDHTLPDLFAGAFVGLLSGAIVYYCYLNYSKLKRPKWFTRQKFTNSQIPTNTFSIE